MTIAGCVVRAAVAFAALGTVACSHVGTSSSGLNTVTGEAWYVRTTNFLGLPVAKSVWYCAPPTDEPGHPICREAKLVILNPESEVRSSGESERDSTLIYTGDRKPEPEKPEPAEDADLEDAVEDEEEEESEDAGSDPQAPEPPETEGGD